MRLTLGILLLSLLPATPTYADPSHGDDKHGKKHRHANDDDEDHYAAACFFQPHDVRIIREYYEPRYRSLPPGLAKKYYRTGHLPPGWAKKMQPLPVVVERELVVLPRGYRRGVIDGSVVVYSPSQQILIDVIWPFRP
jgi:hypothetical protein